MIELTELVVATLFILVILGFFLLYMVSYWAGWNTGYDCHKAAMDRVEERKAKEAKDQAKAKADAWIEEQMKKDGVI